MNRNIEDRLRVALAAKANTVTEWDLQPGLLPQRGAFPTVARRIRRMLLWGAPVFAAASLSGLAFAGVLTSTQHHAAPSMSTGSTPPGSIGPAGSPPSPGATQPAGTIASTGSGTSAALAALPAGGPVPAGFQPASVTFVSPTFGYVLGEPASCASAPCTSMVRTTDRGAHWIGVPAPRATLGELNTETISHSPATVSEVRFADPYNGWAYGPALWVTHDGARTWHPVDVSGQVLALETGGGRVDAIVANCEGTASCAGSPTRLLSSPVGRDAFSQVAAEPTGISAPGGGYGAAAITLHPPAGFAMLGATSTFPAPPAEIVATGGSGWSTFSDPCRVVRNSSLSSFVAPDPTTLVSLCTGSGAAGSTSKTVVLTQNGKSTPLGNPPLGGDGGLIAANGISTILVAARSGDDFLYRSTDSGRTWTTLQFHDGGIGLSDLGFTTDNQAVVIHGQPPLAPGNPPAELLMTTDAGATWHQVNF